MSKKKKKPVKKKVKIVGGVIVKEKKAPVRKYKRRGNKIVRTTDELIHTPSDHQRSNVKIRTNKERGKGRREWEAQYKSDARKALRDLYPIPFNSINWKRRLECKFNLELFGKTYFPAICNLPLSEDHRTCISKMETIALEGGMFALAMPRGQGKTSWCIICMCWLIAYGHRKFLMFIGSRDDKAQETLDAIKTNWYRSNTLYEDFPEVAYPIRKIENRHHLTWGQLYQDISTHLTWGSGEVNFACISLTPEDAEVYLKNDPDSVIKVDDRVERDEDGNETLRTGQYLTKSSGCIVHTTGIGGSIRGEVVSHPVTLQQVRPDLVLLDDIQKDQGADSIVIIQKLIRLIDGAVSGLAGPNEEIAALMPCTVIQKDDVSDTFLNVEKKPSWRGERCKLVTKWPDGITDHSISPDTEPGRRWLEYEELRRKSLIEYQDIRLAREYYIEHREILDQGFEVSWKERKKKDVSAQQHAMNLRFESPLTFPAEYQNNPLTDEDENDTRISVHDLRRRVSGLERYQVPVTTNHIVCHLDVHSEIFHYNVLAADLEFGGSFIDYGSWPEVPTVYFTKRNAAGWRLLTREFFNANPKEKAKAERNKQGHALAELEAKIYHNLWVSCDYLLAKEYLRMDAHGNTMRITKLGIDARWGPATKTIRQFIADYKNPMVVATFGQGISPDMKQYEEYDRTAGWLFEDQIHPGKKTVDWIWRFDKSGNYYLSMDVNRLKTFVHQRLSCPVGSRSAITLFNAPPDKHAMWADHVRNSEDPETINAKNRDKDIWKVKNGHPDNDFFDTAVGCMALASWSGSAIRDAGDKAGKRKDRPKRRSLSAKYAAKKGK